MLLSANTTGPTLGARGFFHVGGATELSGEAAKASREALLALMLLADGEREDLWGAFHLVKNSENSGLGLNEKRFFGSPDWMGSISAALSCLVQERGLISRTAAGNRAYRLENSQRKWNCSEGRPVFPVETSQWKFVFHLQIARLYHQFQAIRGLLSIIFSFLEAFCEQTFRATPSSACHVLRPDPENLLQHGWAAYKSSR